MTLSIATIRCTINKMAFVNYLKNGEGLKIGDAVFIMQSERGARIVLEVDKKIVITKLSKEEIKNERWRKHVEFSGSSPNEDNRASDKKRADN
jgi:hypothetical protein